MLLTIPLIIVAGILVWVLRPREKLTNSRRLAILATLIPTGVVAVAAVIFQLLYNATGEVGISDIPNILFIIGLCLIGVAILALAGFALKRNGEVVKGIGLSICIAVIVCILAFGLLEWLAGV